MNPMILYNVEYILFIKYMNSRPVAEQEESTHPPLQLDKHPEQSTPALFLPLHAPIQVD